MLGKLIRQEWKDTWRVCLLLLGAVLLVTLLGCVSFLTPMWSGMEDGRLSFQLADLLGVMLLFASVITLIGIAFGMFLYLGVHFYRSMYTEQGYLTHTLPVTAHQLLLGKTVVAWIWYFLLQAAVFGCMLLMVFCLMLAVMNPAGIGFGELLDLIRQTAEMIGIESIGATQLLMQVVDTAASVIMLFGAITLGQLSSKHRVIMSLVWYMGITMAEQVIVTLLMIPVTAFTSRRIVTGEVESTMAALAPIHLMTMVIVLVVAVGLYFVSHAVITHRLNLE